MCIVLTGVFIFLFEPLPLTKMKKEKVLPHKNFEEKYDEKGTILGGGVGRKLNFFPIGKKYLCIFFALLTAASKRKYNFVKLTY